MGTHNMIPYLHKKTKSSPKYPKYNNVCSCGIYIVRDSFGWSVVLGLTVL